MRMPGQTIKENITTRVLLFSFWQTDRGKSESLILKIQDNWPNSNIGKCYICISSGDKIEIEATGDNKPLE